jgi:hypothetical protein
MWLPIAAGLGSAFAGIFGANRAANAQERAADGQLQLGREQMAMGREIYDEQRADADNALARMIAVANGTAGGNQRAIQGGFQGQQGNARQMRDVALQTAQTTLQGQLRDFRPYALTGGRANNALAFELGLADRPANYRGFQETPGYQFTRDQGMRAIDGSAAARGGLLSGATLRDSMEYSTGLANQFQGQHLDRLAGQQAMGLAASGAMAGARGQYADRATGATNNFGSMMAGAIGDRTAGLVNVGNNRGNALMNALAQWSGSGAAAGSNFMSNAGASNSLMANALANLGDARAAGAVGGANAITGGIQNGLGLWSYLQNLNGGGATGPAAWSSGV